MSIRLTESEKREILAERAKVTRQKELEKFQFHALQVAARWARWNKKHDEGLTFSTFVNSFGYEEKDVQRVYAAVQIIMEAVEQTA